MSVLLKLDSALNLKECKGTQTTAGSKKDASTQTLGLVSTDRPPDFIYTLFCNGVPAEIREKEGLSEFKFF